MNRTIIIKMKLKQQVNRQMVIVVENCRFYYRAIFFQISGSLYATIFKVSTTADSGLGSLRQPITSADVNFPIP
jgi:hypothetical protein